MGNQESRFMPDLPDTPHPRPCADAAATAASTANSPDFNAARLPGFSTTSPQATTGPTSSELEAMERELDNLQTQLSLLKDIATRPLATAQAATWPDQQSRELDPEQPLVLDQQIWMLHEVEENGVAGLNRVMVEIARELDGRVVQLNSKLIKDRKTKSKTWEHVLNRSNDTVLMNMLNTIEVEVLKSLICGDLMARYYEDMSFQEKVLANHTLKKKAGNYLQLLVRAYTLPMEEPPTPASHSTQAHNRVVDRYAGRGLTFRQLFLLQNAVLKYATDHDFAKSVDDQYPGDKQYAVADYSDPSKDKSNTQGGWRRYFPNAEARQRIEEWSIALQYMYTDEISELIQTEKVTGVTNSKLDIPMRRVFAECGWGFDQGERASAHEDFRKSNNLFTFYRALVKILFDQYDILYEIKKFMINRLPRTGKQNAKGEYPEVFEDANTSDVGMSLLVWCFWFMCGMNPHPAAGGGVAKRHIKNYMSWIVENMEYIYRDGALSQTNLKKYEKKYEKVEAREERRAKTSEIKRELQRQKDELKEKTGERQQELAKMKAAVQVVKVKQKWQGFGKMLKGEMKWPDKEYEIDVEQSGPQYEREAQPETEWELSGPLRQFSTSPSPSDVIHTPRRAEDRSSSEVPIIASYRPGQGAQPSQTQTQHLLAPLAFPLSNDNMDDIAAGFAIGQMNDEVEDQLESSDDDENDNEDANAAEG